MLYYTIAALAAAVIYAVIGKQAALFVFLAAVAYKMYEAYRFLQPGEAETVRGPQGEILQWKFRGFFFSFTADLEAMTAHLVAPRVVTLITDLRWSSQDKRSEGPVDLVLPLRAIDVHTHDDTETRHTSYSATGFGYRTDGSFGQVWVPQVLTSAAKTGNVRLSLHVQDGAKVDTTEPETTFRSWARNRTASKVTFLSLPTMSRRQANSFVDGWKVIERAIAEANTAASTQQT